MNFALDDCNHRAVPYRFKALFIVLFPFEMKKGYKLVS
jgi:hypothetical protein